MKINSWEKGHLTSTFRPGSIVCKKQNHLNNRREQSLLQEPPPLQGRGDGVALDVVLHDAESITIIHRLTHRLAVARERLVNITVARHCARQVRQLLQVVGVAADMN